MLLFLILFVGTLLALVGYAWYGQSESTEERRAQQIAKARGTGLSSDLVKGSDALALYANRRSNALNYARSLQYQQDVAEAYDTGAV